MDQPDRGGALPDGAGEALDRAVPDVASDETPWHACLDPVAASEPFPSLPGSPTRADLLECLRPVVAGYLEHAFLLRALSDTAGSDERARETLRSPIAMASAGFAVAIRASQERGVMRRELEPEGPASWLIWAAARDVAEHRPAWRLGTERDARPNHLGKGRKQRQSVDLAARTRNQPHAGISAC